MKPSGTWAKSYVQDRRLLRSRYHVTGLAVLLAALAVYPLLVPDEWIRFAVVTAISLIAVLGLQLLVGLSGQVSVGQSAFLGIGAYASGVSAVHYGLGLLPSLLLGGLGAAAVGFVFALPAVRIRGFYLALTTLAVQFVFAFVVVRLPSDVFGGDAGIFMPTPSLVGIDVSGEYAFYYLSITVAGLATAVALSIQESSLGRALVAVRDNDVAAEMTGVPVNRLKLLAFAIASGFGGVAGALLAYENGFVNVTQYTLFASILFLGMLIVGGVGTVLGAFLGVLTLRLVEELMTQYGSGVFEAVGVNVAGRTGAVVNVVVGAAICVMLIVEPKGLAHLYRRGERYARLWPFPYASDPR